MTTRDEARWWHTPILWLLYAGPILWQKLRRR